MLTSTLRNLVVTILPVVMAAWLVGCQPDQTATPTISSLPRGTDNVVYGSTEDNSHPSPMATPDTSDSARPCGPSAFDISIDDAFEEHFLIWTPNGTELIISNGTTIGAVDLKDSELRTIVDANPGFQFWRGFFADASPDGKIIAYSSCEYRTDGSATYRYSERDEHQYEVASVGINGAPRERLTENDYFDHYPTWSPDGTRIAFVANPLGLGHLNPKQAQLFTMAPDGSDIRLLTPSLDRVGFYPPVWSPSGRSLAFIVDEGEYYPFKRILYTMESDGSELNRIGETTALPTRSPLNRELAFAKAEGGEALVYTVRPDGTELRQRWSSGPDVPSALISQLKWSPDGSELLFVADDGVYVVSLDGTGLLKLAFSSNKWPTLGAWSPDGSQIVIYYPGNQRLGGRLLRMDRDGTDLRVLLEGDAGGKLLAWNPHGPEAPVDLAACYLDFVVPRAGRLIRDWSGTVRRS